MKEYLRINCNCGFYVDISKEHNLVANESLEELSKVNEKITDDDSYAIYFNEQLRLERMVEKNCIITITFAAIALEAFIYDYAAIYFGDVYVKKYIDKLDVVSKWVVIPKMVTGKEIPRDRNCFELFKQTIKLRNEFIHSKSRNFNEENAIELINRFSAQQLVKYSNDAVKAIYELANQIEIIDPEIKAKFLLHTER